MRLEGADDRELGLGLPGTSGEERDDARAGSAADHPPLVPVDDVHPGDAVRRGGRCGHGGDLLQWSGVQVRSKPGVNR